MSGYDVCKHGRIRCAECAYVEELEDRIEELEQQNKRYRQALERIINIRNSSDVMFLEENSYEDIVYHIVTKVLEGEE